MSRHDLYFEINNIARSILLIRGQKVMLDFHLAELYGVETKALKRAIKRNLDRFPSDFCFELTREEWQNLRYQFGTSNWGGMRYLPYAFTEQGVSMLSSVLKSKRAIQVNIAIMRTFVKLREMFSTHNKLAQKLSDLERKFEKHDTQIRSIFEAIRRLMGPTEKPKRQIGFRVEEPRMTYSIKKLKTT